MSRWINGALVIAAAVAVGACSESATAPNNNVNSLSTAFASTLAGYGSTLNSFSSSADSLSPWGPGDHDGDGRGGHHGMGGPEGRHGPGFGGPGFGMDGGMMGGGLGDLFRGFGFGHDFGHGLHGDTTSEHGLTITRTVVFKDASGATQPAFDSLTTNSVNEKVSVSGTVTRRDGATSTVSHQSDRTISGLASGSTQRTVNGTSAGSEQTAGSDSAGAFTVTRVAGDTTSNVVIPVPASTSTTPPYPISGTIIRSMRATVTHAGTTTSSSRREVVTYDGSSTAKVQITQDGTTKSCTVALPHGRLTCS